jgi:hypothetical protein
MRTNTIDYRYLNNHIVENFDMARREQERATEATKKVADEAKKIETERSATHTLPEIGQQQRLTNTTNSKINS